MLFVSTPTAVTSRNAFSPPKVSAREPRTRRADRALAPEDRLVVVWILQGITADVLTDLLFDTDLALTVESVTQPGRILDERFQRWIDLVRWTRVGEGRGSPDWRTGPCLRDVRRQLHRGDR